MYSDMDIDILSRMVRELLLDHDKVSLPGLGSFVAEMAPSVISDKGYTINPPYRKLYFREGQGGDELLVAFYASLAGVEEEVAREVLVTFIAEMRQVLNRQKVIVFPELGRLRATKENNYFFVADEDMDIFPEGLGLEPVSLKAHAAGGHEEKPSEEPKDNSETEEHHVEEIHSEEIHSEEEEIEAKPSENQEEEKIIEVKKEEKPSEEPTGNSVTEEHHVGEAHSGEEEIEATLSEEEKIADGQNAEKPTCKSGEATLPEGEKTGTVHNNKVMKVVLWSVLGAAAAVALLLGAFVLLSHLCPDFIDSLLYSKEELELINR